MTNSSHRIDWIDSVKAFSIMAVVLNHTALISEIKAVVYLVCLPAFFFVAGMFTNTQLSYKEFFMKKTMRLLIPFIIWGGLSWLAWLVIGRKYGADSQYIYSWWYPLFGMIYGNVETLIQNPPLWFLCCMISLEWIYYFISRIRSLWLRWIIIAAFAVCGCLLAYWEIHLIWGMTAALIILPVYAVGAGYKTRIKTDVLSYHSSIYIIILICSAVGVLLGSRINGDIQLAKCQIGIPAIYYFSIICVIGFWISIAILIKKLWGEIRILQYIGQNTLLVLCTHIPIFGMIKGICLLFHIPLSFFDTTLGCLVLWIGAFIILLPIAYLINHYCPIAVGKLPKRPTPLSTSETPHGSLGD